MVHYKYIVVLNIFSVADGIMAKVLHHDFGNSLPAKNDWKRIKALLGWNSGTS